MEVTPVWCGKQVCWKISGIVSAPASISFAIADAGQLSKIFFDGSGNSFEAEVTAGMDHNINVIVVEVFRLQFGMDSADNDEGIRPCFFCLGRKFKYDISYREIPGQHQYGRIKLCSGKSKISRFCSVQNLITAA